jgi:glycosyltransferase involved in cell wall biosynthesis
MQKDKLKICVYAFACDPTLGSESGVGWHWVLEMSKYFDLWVLVSGLHQPAIEAWLEEHPEYADIHFIFYDWPKWALWWKKGLSGMRIYYNLWILSTNRLVRKIMRENDIHIFHHLTYGNAIWPVIPFGQRQFFIWGPVGGLESVPRDFSKHYQLKDRVVEQIRRWIAGLSKYNLGFRGRCRRADLILCKTDYTRGCIQEAYRHKTVLFTDVAADISESVFIKTSEQRNTEFVTVGRLDAWRGFDLAIEALGLAVKQRNDIHLTIVGEGSDRPRLEAMIRQRNLQNHVTLTGTLSMTDYRQRMQQADVVVNAALKEGAVTVSFDAMAWGKPLLCVDTTGYTRYFKEDYSIVIPRHRREQVIKDLAEGMVRLTDAEIRHRMGERAKTAAREISWAHHGEEIHQVILEAYSHSKQ